MLDTANALPLSHAMTLLMIPFISGLSSDECFVLWCVLLNQS